MSVKRGNRPVDIGASLSLKNLDAATSARAEGPRTAAGELLAERRQNLEEANSRLQARVNALEGEVQYWSEAKPVIQLDPKLVEPSRFANRLEESFASEDFRIFTEEIVAAGGNVQPIKVAAIPGTSPQRYSIIFGHRRHRACLNSGLLVNAIVENLNDRAQFIEMERENRGRRELSTYEQGIWYLRAITPVTSLTSSGEAGWGLFSSRVELAAALGVDKSNVSRACQIAELPNAVLDAFPARNEIQFRWATELHRAMTNNLSGLIARANAVTRRRSDGESLTSKDVYALLTADESAPEEIGASEVEITNKDGGLAAKLIRDKSGKTRIVFAAPLNEKATDKIVEFLGKLF